MTSARRALWLLVLGAVGGAAYSVWRERQTPTDRIDPPEWPPLRPTTTTDTGPDVAIHAGAPATRGTVATEPSTPQPNAAAFVNALVDTPDARSTSADGRWIPPNEDGSCPDGFPIKANDNSGIYHVPGGRFYVRTRAERCYATAEGAEADGYRAAKT